MASSRKSPKSSALVSHVSAILEQHVGHADRVCAAVSGGVDSVVLFDVLQRLSRRHGFRLSALHVNHQLSRNAGRWEDFCRKLCRARRIPFTAVRVSVSRGDSLEAAARTARYHAFAAQPARFIALAHNLDDQVETLLLQLLRGAGIKGLSAMPVMRKAEGGRRKAEGGRMKQEEEKGTNFLHPSSFILHPSILRPLLDIPRSEIEAYARQRKLKWVEDESNSDVYYDRNFLRHRVLPLIAKRYPAYRKTLARTSRNLAEAAQLLDELGEADAKLAAGTLGISVLRGLSAARAKNALRRFFAIHQVKMPNVARLDECLRQVLHARPDARLTIDLDSHDLRRFGDSLRVVPKTAKLPRGYCREWRGEATLCLPEFGGTLVVTKSRGTGISRNKLAAGAVTVRSRQGGERLRPDARRPRRSLKNLLQEACMPPWERDRLPLVFCGKALVFVPGIGIDCEFQADAGEPGIDLCWEAG